MNVIGHYHLSPDEPGLGLMPCTDDFSAASAVAKIGFRSLLQTVRNTMTGSLCRSIGDMCAGCLRPASDFISGGTRAVVSQISRAPTARTPSINKIARPLDRRHVRRMLAAGI